MQIVPIELANEVVVVVAAAGECIREHIFTLMQL